MPHKIVVKLGTQVVMDPTGSGPHLGRLWAIVGDIARLLKLGHSILVVSSGAVGLGRLGAKKIGTNSSLPSVHEKQAFAAIGQSLLMDTYRDLFSPYGIVTAQVLLTSDDFSIRSRYLTLTSTLEKLLEFSALPIINENDVVSELGLKESSRKSFDDNDKLAALVASKLGADILVLLTDVDGVYSENPKTKTNAKLVKKIETAAMFEAIVTQGSSTLGRGGMRSKLDAAKLAGLCGVTTIISSGSTEAPITEALDLRRGTLIPPTAFLPGKKRWIASSGYVATIVVNGPTRDALKTRKISLLPVGIVRIDGEFAAKDVVAIHDESGLDLGRGVVDYSSHIVDRIRGKKSKEAREIEPKFTKDEVIHCDNLVTFGEA